MDRMEISLEFDKIKMKWAECALTEAARKAIQDTRLILSETELAARLRETTESRQMLEKCGTPPLTALEGIEELLAVAEKGQCLTPRELEKTAIALVALERLKSYLERGKAYEIPLAYYEENLNPLEELREQLYCRPPGFTVMPPGKYLAGGLQSGCTANSTGVQYKIPDLERTGFRQCLKAAEEPAGRYSQGGG